MKLQGTRVAYLERQGLRRFPRQDRRREQDHHDRPRAHQEMRLRSGRDRGADRPRGQPRPAARSLWACPSCRSCRSVRASIRRSCWCSWQRPARVLLVQDVVAQRRAAPARCGRLPAEPPRAYGLVLAAFVAVAIYIALLPLLGFRIATALFVAGVPGRAGAAGDAAPMGHPDRRSPIATSAVTYLVFERYLSVILPRGRWTDW